MRKHNSRLSIMVAGPKESGKTAFLNSLIDKEAIEQKPISEIEVYLLNLEYEDLPQKLSLIDTPSFGDSLNDKYLLDLIVNYIKEQYDLYISEETKVRRNPDFEDTRVHALLYFIPSTGNGLKQRDIVFLKEICELVNVIPVISKAEGLIESEIQILKDKIKSQMEYYNIKLFDFENKVYLPQHIIDQRLNEQLPFLIVCPDQLEQLQRIRVHPCGVVEIDNPNNSDFLLLKEVLVDSHMSSLVETTSNELYESYRIEALERIIED